MDGGRLMTALEAKRAADNFNQDLFRRALEKTTKYFNKQIEENAYQGSYEFCIRSDNDDLIIAVGKREIFELFHNPDLQKELKKQFRTDGFLVNFDKGYEQDYVRISWREPY
jgi:hypothetical protein